VEIYQPDDNGFWLRINPSLNRMTPEEVTGIFLEAFKESKL
jgi:hypothetical protein